MRQCREPDYYRTDISAALLKRVGIEGFACPKNTSYRVRGDSLDEESTFINLKIIRCNPLNLPNICKSEMEIDNFINNIEV